MFVYTPHIPMCWRTSKHFHINMTTYHHVWVTRHKPGLPTTKHVPLHHVFNIYTEDLVPPKSTLIPKHNLPPSLRFLFYILHYYTYCYKGNLKLSNHDPVISQFAFKTCMHLLPPPLPSVHDFISFSKDLMPC